MEDVRDLKALQLDALREVAKRHLGLARPFGALVAAE